MTTFFTKSCVAFRFQVIDHLSDSAQLIILSLINIHKVFVSECDRHRILYHHYSYIYYFHSMHAEPPRQPGTAVTSLFVMSPPLFQSYLDGSNRFEPSPRLKAGDSRVHITSLWLSSSQITSSTASVK